MAEPTFGQASTGSIRGQVADAQSGARISSAEVSVARAGQTVWVGRTSTDGVFVAPGLEPDFYQVRVAKTGYAPAGPRQRRPGGPAAPVVVGADARVAIDVRMWQLGSLAGVVSDEFGQPVVNVEVRALREADDGGGGFGEAGGDSTDDRGEFRIASLLPGSYLVMVRSTRITYPSSLNVANLQRTRTFSNVELDGAVVEQSNALPIKLESGRLDVYPTTYYPGVRDLQDAQRIAIGPAEAHDGLRIAMAPARATSLSGVVVDPDGRAVPQVLVSAFRPDVMSAGGGAGLESARTTSDASGRFVMHGLPVGRYVLHALRRPSPRPSSTAMQGEAAILLSRFADRLPETAAGLTPPAQPTLSATQEITLDDRPQAISLTLSHAPRVSGRVAFEGATPAARPDEIATLRILFRSVADAPSSLSIPDRVAGDGTFTTYGSPPGRYAIVLQGAMLDRWRLQSAMLDGVDYADRPLTLEDRDLIGLVVTLSDRGASIEGQVGRTGGADREAMVVLFPDDPTLWSNPAVADRRFRESMTDESGRYLISNLPAGDYLVVAATADALRGWRQRPDLDRLAATAVRLHLNEGERHSRDLRISARRP
jgi:hypothetical protein